MAEETQIQEAGNVPMKRNLGCKKGSKGKKRLKVFKGSGEKVKIDKKMKKLCHKKARDYNSDDDEEPTTEIWHKKEHPKVQEEAIDETSSDGEGEDLEDVEVSEDEDGEIQAGITKFAEGCKAFKLAFKRITKKSASDNVLGPVLSAHKKLIAEKLAEEEVDRKVKGEAKKEKHMVGEKGHVKPANFLDAHEKFLIGVATKGVVKLFNAVNKAQNAQKGLNPARSKDAKVIKKRRKEAFFSELSKMPSQSADPSAKRDGEGPAWAPLRDNYMLTNSKLKDWDKTPDTHAADDFGMQADSSSDDED